MAVQRKKPDGLSLPVRLLLAAAVLVGCLLLLPIGKTPTEAPAAENTSAPATPAQLLEEPLPAPETPAEEPPSAVEESADQELAEEEAPAQPEEEYTPIVYDARSYQLVTDMVYAYQKQVSDRGDVIARDVAASKETRH